MSPKLESPTFPVFFPNTPTSICYSGPLGLKATKSLQLTQHELSLKSKVLKYFPPFISINIIQHDP